MPRIEKFQKTDPPQIDQALADERKICKKSYHEHTFAVNLTVLLNISTTVRRIKKIYKTDPPQIDQARSDEGKIL